MDPEHKTKVMMLDDERFLLEVYKSKFEKEGFEVSTYMRVDDALKALREGVTPDIILFDITIPDSGSGYEFIEAVHTEKLAPKALKIALTNEGREGARERMAEFGTDEHLLKVEYLPAELVTKVSELFKAKQR